MRTFKKLMNKLDKQLTKLSSGFLGELGSLAAKKHR